MPITAWNPATKVSRGNVAVNIATAIADIDTPTVAELDTGTGLSCSINTFNGTSSVSSETIDWLCTTESEQLPGSVSHAIDDLVIKTTGQADTTLVMALKVGDVIYVWRRDGIPHDDPVVAGQFVWVWRCVITSIDPAEANNTFVGIVAHISVLSRTQVPVAVVA